MHERNITVRNIRVRVKGTRLILQRWKPPILNWFNSEMKGLLPAPETGCGEVPGFIREQDDADVQGKHYLAKVHS